MDAVVEIQQSIAEQVSRHWTVHAVERFIERYGAFDIDPQAFHDFVPRIEYRWRALFNRLPKRGKWSRIALITVRSWSPHKCGMVKVRVIYDHQTRVVITVLPPRLDDRKRKILSLVV